ncbi:MAG TPA: sigma-70 family RNA polymerase sigma factor [Pedobacter sp.]|uniref:RNA polymerase sigma factor n=1 Tax=Pedobacter sp. TaxID=1411316 RepID=UPI002C38BF18|nr:sigma-70 family RNA polymerase sigma factor [Pedobacter sp.]HMI03571.1 sigma-70 family RNA polymerase sigma factor [Pedobacter sp.]
MSFSEISDVELWSAIQLDDENAFRLLFDRYWTRLYKTAFRLTKDMETSKEIVHDIFINIWDRRHVLSINSIPKFLLTSVRYQYYNRTRAAKSPIVLTADYNLLDQTSTLNEAETRQAEYDIVCSLKQQLVNLPKRCQEIFLMSRVDNLTNEEIAEQLHISKRTVENQITHALKHLRNTLEDHSVLFTFLCLMTLYK